MNKRPLPAVASATFTQRLLSLGVGLTVVFTAISPQASEPLSLFPRLLFWGLHIGIGLAAAVVVADRLVRHTCLPRDWRLVLYSGLSGLILFAPFAYGLESLFPLAEPGADDDWSDRLASTSVFAAVLVEALELAPVYLATWLFINYTSPASVAITGSLTKPQSPTHGEQRDVNETASHEHAVIKELESEDNSDVLPESSSEASAREMFLDRLPPIIGRDLIAVSSDLHYLQVITREGKAMVLGALQEIEQSFGERGLRVHRSHWVSLDAVVSLRKIGSGWQLELVDGHRVPVSRRKKSLVQARLGEDFVRVRRSA